MMALSDADAGVRSEAAQALGNLGPLAQDAIPQLVKALTDMRCPGAGTKCAGAS